MIFTRVGDPRKVVPGAIKRAKSEFHTPPFREVVYAFLPGCEEVFLFGGWEAIFEKGFFVFDYHGPVWAHDLDKKTEKWYWRKFESADSEEFTQHFERALKETNERNFAFDHLEVCLSLTSAGEYYGEIIEDKSLFPWSCYDSLLKVTKEGNVISKEGGVTRCLGNISNTRGD